MEQLSADEQSSRLKDMESKLVSPIERIRFSGNTVSSTTTAPDRLNQAKAQLDWLTDEKAGLAHGRAMLTVVRWVHLRLGWHEETSKWPAFIRLVWLGGHGCTLYRAFSNSKTLRQTALRNGLKTTAKS